MKRSELAQMVAHLRNEEVEHIKYGRSIITYNPYMNGGEYEIFYEEDTTRYVAFTDVFEIADFLMANNCVPSIQEICEGYINQYGQKIIGIEFVEQPNRFCSMTIDTIPWTEFSQMSADEFEAYKLEWMPYYEKMNDLADQDYDREKFIEDGLEEWIADVLSGALLSNDGSCDWDTPFKDEVSHEAVAVMLTQMFYTNTSIY